jgi:prepilin-type N-terminal cleavage/methylation domain-containing protein
MARNARRHRTGEHGFSMIEILIVVAIIMAVAAVSLPAIGRYIRNYQIRGASQQVLGEIQTARNKAIMKNVNFGVVFVALSPNTYQYVIEDDQNPVGGMATAPVNISTLRDCDPPANRTCVQAGPIQRLPTGIQFGNTCPGFTAGAKAFRYNRLGTWCDPSGGGACPLSVIDVGQNLFQNSAQGTTICITQPSTGLFRRVMVAPGGRAMTDR